MKSRLKSRFGGSRLGKKKHFSQRHDQLLLPSLLQISSVAELYASHWRTPGGFYGGRNDNAFVPSHLLSDCPL